MQIADSIQREKNKQKGKGSQPVPSDHAGLYFAPSPA